MTFIKKKTIQSGIFPLISETSTTFGQIIRLDNPQCFPLGKLIIELVDYLRGRKTDGNL